MARGNGFALTRFIRRAMREPLWVSTNVRRTRGPIAVHAIQTQFGLAAYGRREGRRNGGAREPALAKLPNTSQVGTSLGLRSNRQSAFAERLQLCNVFATVVGCRANRCHRAAARIWPSGAHAYPALGWAGHDGHQQDRL